MEINGTDQLDTFLYAPWFYDKIEAVLNDEEPLCQFALAGADRKFEWAEAKIVNGSVEVSSKSVPNPVYLRYAWSNNPDGANL